MLFCPQPGQALTWTASPHLLHGGRGDSRENPQAFLDLFISKTQPLSLSQWYTELVLINWDFLKNFLIRLHIRSRESESRGGGGVEPKQLWCLKLSRGLRGAATLGTTALFPCHPCCPFDKQVLTGKHQTLKTQPPVLMRTWPSKKPGSRQHAVVAGPEQDTGRPQPLWELVSSPKS